MPKQTTKKTEKKSVEKTAKKTVTKKTTEKSKSGATKINKSAVDNKNKKAKKTNKLLKSKAAKILVFTNDTESFWVNNGQILNSMIALQEALQTMEEEIFSYHVNDERNDFAEWVEKVLCDDNCASDLRRVKDRDKAYKVVTKYLKTYTF